MVLQDYPMEGMKVIWEGHVNNMQVREWINEVGSNYIQGWVDIQHYAGERNWSKALVVPSSRRKFGMG